MYTDIKDIPRFTPFWVVYGPQCFPQSFCAVLVDYNHGLPDTAIWGYSVYKGVPGFRTLGQDVYTWIEKHEARLFETRDGALSYLLELLTPHPDVVYHWGQQRKEKPCH